MTTQAKITIADLVDAVGVISEDIHLLNSRINDL